MYATCISCHAPLGANEMLEPFPVGRKLAFDASTGRLWVICRTCRQWNLSPLEERWEAIEAAERLYRDTPLRASTGQVGLARLRDGTELVRIGAPLRPEFAAWRYGDRFARRWTLRGPAAAVAGAVGLVSKYGGAYLLLQVAALPVLAAVVASFGLEGVRMGRTDTELAHPDGGRVRLTLAHVESLRLLRDHESDGGWHLRVQHSPRDGSRRMFNSRDPELVVRGAEALRVATRLLPRVNRVGGRRRTVDEAVRFLERAGSPDAVFRLASRLDPDSARTERGALPRPNRPDGDAVFASAFVRADAPIRLAVEMAAHEEQERALLAGELADLEAQWREADAIAAIADGLTLPPAVLERLERIRLR